MKFKAGDIIQIKSLDEVMKRGAHYYKFSFVEDMQVYCGTVLKIKKIDDIGKVYFENSSSDMQKWNWSESMLDPYIPLSEPSEDEIMALI